MKVKKILVSQPKPTAEKSPYFDLESKYGVQIDFRPFIRVEGVTAKEFRTQKVDILDHTAIVFTARTAVDNFFRLCGEMKITIPETMKYFFTSENLSQYIQKYVAYRKRKIFFSEDGSVQGLVEAIKKHSAEKYLVVVSDVYDENKSIQKDHKDDIVSVMNENDIPHTKAVMYRTVSTDFTQDPDFKYDMFVFFSPSGITSLYKNFPNFVQGDIKIGCFGPTAVKAAEEAGLTVNIAAPNEKAKSMAEAMDLYFKENADK